MIILYVVLPIIVFLLMIHFGIYLFTKYNRNNKCLVELENILKIHYPHILEKVIIIGDDKSFTINKKFVHLCVADDYGKCYDINTLLYVVLHEFAHVESKSVGHTDEFNKIFKDLLQQAEQKGIYDPKKPIQNYCHY